MKNLKKQNVKMNLTLEPDFFEMLQENAKRDYVKTATWTKQYLMKKLLEKNNSDLNCITQNGNRMGN